MSKKKSPENIKRIVKGLPENIGLMSLAVLLSIAEAGVTTAAGILEGPKTGIARAYSKSSAVTTPWEYYEALKDYKINNLRAVISRLAKKGLVEKQPHGYTLSKVGKLFTKRIKEAQKPKIWDGKWRIVMFDIPEKRKNDCYWLVTQLLAAEYKNLQKSVYLGKYPLAEDF